MDSPTPYDGTSAPFTIGLKPLDLKDWIEVDETFNAQLTEKRRLYAKLPDKVLVEEPETRDAQQELLDLITAHMAAHFPEKPGLTAGLFLCRMKKPGHRGRAGCDAGREDASRRSVLRRITSCSAGRRTTG